MTEVRITHIGGPTVLLQLGGWRNLADPTFDLPGHRSIRWLPLGVEVELTA